MNALTVSSTDATAPNPVDLLAVCKAYADQLRLDILQVLSRDSFGVQELCSIFDSKQSGMSHHLKILASASLVVSRREGNSIFYRRAYHSASDGAIDAVHQTLHRAIDLRPLAASVRLRVAAVQEQRAARSQAFFNDHAGTFRAQQEQVADYTLYGPQTALLLNRLFSSSKKGVTALELGPGEGAFLGELAARFEQVIALDNSAQMLEQARQCAASQALQNIHFIHGDTKNEALHSADVDCVVINMVLHHIPSPAEIFTDINGLLKPGGALIVTDLCNHDQTWVSESCGDVWLGFAPEDLSQWAEDAGFSAGEAVYLAQRNGFRVQIRQFTKVAQPGSSLHASQLSPTATAD